MRIKGHQYLLPFWGIVLFSYGSLFAGVRYVCESVPRVFEAEKRGNTIRFLAVVPKEIYGDGEIFAFDYNTKSGVWKVFNTSEMLSRGQLWEKLYKWDIEFTDGFQRYLLKRNKLLRITQGETTGVFRLPEPYSKYFRFSAAFMSENRIWFGIVRCEGEGEVIERKIGYFDLAKETFKILDIAEDVLTKTCSFRDKEWEHPQVITAIIFADDTLWIGVSGYGEFGFYSGKGLICYDLKTKESKIYNPENSSMYGSVVSCIVKNGDEIWFATELGINCFNIKEKKWKTFRMVNKVQVVGNIQVLAQSSPTGMPYFHPQSYLCNLSEKDNYEIADSFLSWVQVVNIPCGFVEWIKRENFLESKKEKFWRRYGEELSLDRNWGYAENHKWAVTLFKAPSDESQKVGWFLNFPPHQILRQAPQSEGEWVRISIFAGWIPVTTFRLCEKLKIVPSLVMLGDRDD